VWCSVERCRVRAMEAAKLYREGYAPEVWLTSFRGAWSKLMGQMGIPFAGEVSTTTLSS